MSRLSAALRKFLNWMYTPAVQRPQLLSQQALAQLRAERAALAGPGPTIWGARTVLASEATPVSPGLSKYGGLPRGLPDGTWPRCGTCQRWYAFAAQVRPRDVAQTSFADGICYIFFRACEDCKPEPDPVVARWLPADQVVDSAPTPVDGRAARVTEAWIWRWEPVSAGHRELSETNSSSVRAYQLAQGRPASTDAYEGPVGSLEDACFYALAIVIADEGLPRHAIERLACDFETSSFVTRAAGSQLVIATSGSVISDGVARIHAARRSDRSPGGAVDLFGEYRARPAGEADGPEVILPRSLDDGGRSWASDAWLFATGAIWVFGKMEAGKMRLTVTRIYEGP